MTTSRLAAVAAIVLILTTLTGCGTPTQPSQPAAAPTAQKKEPVLYTGKQCLSSMQSLALRWQPDALPFHLESDLTTETTGQEGKSTMWRAFFASRNRGTMETFICSGSRLPANPYGITSTTESAYAPNVPALMFESSYLQTDSDKAYATTLQHGGSDLLKKDPQQPVIYLLEWEPKQKALFWYVIYGKNQAERKGIGVINAATGAFVRAGK
jgi:hypothetical protein